MRRTRSEACARGDGWRNEANVNGLKSRVTFGCAALWPRAGSQDGVACLLLRPAAVFVRLEISRRFMYAFIKQFEGCQIPKSRKRHGEIDVVPAFARGGFAYPDPEESMWMPISTLLPD